MIPPLGFALLHQRNRKISKIPCGIACVFWGGRILLCLHLFLPILIVPIPSPIHPYKKKQQPKTATLTNTSSAAGSRHSIGFSSCTSVTAINPPWCHGFLGFPSDRSCSDLLFGSPQNNRWLREDLWGSQKKGHPVAPEIQMMRKQVKLQDASRTYWLFFVKERCEHVDWGVGFRSCRESVEMKMEDWTFYFDIYIYIGTYVYIEVHLEMLETCVDQYMGTMDFKPLRYFNAAKSHRRRYHVATSSAGEREAAAAAGRSSDQPRIEERRRSVDIGTGNIEGSKENILPSGRHLTNPYILNVTNFFPAISYHPKLDGFSMGRNVSLLQCMLAYMRIWRRLVNYLLYEKMQPYGQRAIACFIPRRAPWGQQYLTFSHGTRLEAVKLPEKPQCHASEEDILWPKARRK